MPFVILDQKKIKKKNVISIIFIIKYMMMMILQEQDLAENKICGLTQKVCTHIDIFYISWNIFTQFFFGGEEEKVNVSTKKMAPPTTSDSYTYNSINIWVEKNSHFQPSD